MINLSVKSKKLIYLFIAACAIISIILITHALINNSTINLIVAPASSEIKIDDHKVTNGEIKVTPGKHLISVVKDGFASQSKEIDVSAWGKENAFIILNSNSQDTKNWFLEHPEDQSLIDKISLIESNEAGEMYSEKYPVTNILPYSVAEYRIDYGEDGDLDFAILIDAFDPAGYNKAIKYLNDNSIDLGKYPFVFTDFENPFAGFTTTQVSEDRQLVNSEDEEKIREYINNLFSSFIHTIQKIDYVDNYIIASISYTISEDFPGDITYRFILQKMNNSYQLITTPNMILSYNDYLEIPEDVIKAANNL